LTIREKQRNAEQRVRRRKRLKYIVILLIVLLAGLSAVTARWFIWPPQGMPTRVDAIVMLDGTGDRLDTALNLVRERRAPVLVISYTLNQPLWSDSSVCAPKVTEAKVICFIANPATTRGEAESIGRIASKYHWHSIVLVATAPQDPVALLRASRCFTGKIYMINASFPASQWPSQVAHYWGGALRALFLQRSC
jgi:hypothetical protein